MFHLWPLNYGLMYARSRMSEYNLDVVDNGVSVEVAGGRCHFLQLRKHTHTLCTIGDEGSSARCIVNFLFSERLFFFFLI